MRVVSSEVRARISTILKQRHGPVIDRFLSYVNKTDTCWLWTGSVSKQTGYGRFWCDGPIGAHQWSYAYFRGVMSSSRITVDHTCRIRSCVNPDHLELVPQRINVERGIAGTLLSERQLLKYRNMTSCLRGHEYNDQNTRVVLRGRYKIRKCRVCELMHYHAKRRLKA